MSKRGLPKEAKYEDYQLEGEKENYKEVLVTMPNKGNLKERWGVFDKNGRFVSSYNSEDKAISKSESIGGTYRLASNVGQPDPLKNFQSTHFDEPNILVHLRMNTRTDSEGNKVLFLEEVQSDWGQKGKKEGFKKTINERKKEILETKGVKIQDTGGSYYGVMFGDQLLTSILKESWDDGVSGTIADVERVLNKYNPNQDTPSAPFITDTNAWTKLGLKVALKEAVAQGAERIAWTTGEQQNERYDLSEQVNKIVVQKQEDGR